MKYLVVLLLLMGSPAFARLGETPAECKARYGEPLEARKGESVLAFKKAGLIVLCEFFEGKCASIGFIKDEESSADAGSSAKFSVAEIETLREANGGGKKWMIFDEKAPGVDIWKTHDGDRRAFYRTLDSMLIIQTKGYLKRAAAAEKAAEEKKKLEGF